jgi:hypothetical protein
MSNPDGPARPVLPPRTQRQLDDGSLPDQYHSTSHLAPPAPPDASEIAGVNTPPILPYLTPDAMLVYCQSRLSGINSQCREIMTRQENNAKDQATLGNLLSTLYLFQDGANNTPGANQKVEAAYDKAVEDAGGPESPLGKQLAKDRAELFAGGDKNAMQSLINATKSHQSELNSDSEIDMIRLQSLMSQRQTAIQLTTNIVQSLNDQANKIVANIGH